ncbi:MAG TPA: NYN domain-containing protein [Leptolyngbya sp.]|jgi:uncharacterized LabA/DUF88 family protein|nr:NYN domain-containing protein [Leptolyngbya sp.]
MIQLVQEPTRDERSLPFHSLDSSEQLPLPVLKEFDETDAPTALHRGRLMIFIDGANLFYAASQMGIEIDYAKLLRYFQQQSLLIYAFFYTGVDPNNTRQRAFLTWMQRNGYRVVTKEVVLNAVGTKRASNMNVEIAVDMMRFAQDCDTEILISGDGDMSYAINAVSYLGAKVEVLALRSTAHDSIPKVADNFIDLLSVRDEIQKTPRQ